MNRRTFILGLGAFGAALTLPQWIGGGAFAQGRQSFGRVVVDTRPLEARGGRLAASVIAPRLRQSLQREFAGSLGRGPVLTVRVLTVSLSINSAGADRGGIPSDYLEAEVSAGNVRFPLLVTQPANVAGRGYLGSDEPLRLQYLADSLASWVRRRI